MNINNQTTNPGDLNVSVTLQNRVTTPDAGGFQIQSWTNIATVWAKWRNVHGSEAWQAAAIAAEGAATVTIRYRSDVNETCAVLKGSERYEIISLDNIQERSEYIELKVRRVRDG